MVRLVLLIGLTLTVVVTGVACSDAPTEVEIERADDGVDPSIVIVMITPDLEPVMEQLGVAFAETRRGATFRFVVDTPENLDRRIADGYRPSLWISTASSIATIAADPDAQGAPAEFGETPMQMIVHEDAGIVPPPTLAAFGADADTTSGLCAPAVACGAGARLVLEQAGVVPDPDLDEPDTKALAKAFLERKVDIALVYQPEAIRLGSVSDVIPLPDPTIGLLPYQTISFGRAPIAAEFQRWLAAAPEATDILVNYGWKPKPSATRP